GHQGNEGVVQKLLHKVFGGGGGHPVWYQLDDGSTSALDVGAAPGTSVFAPVDGTVVGITPYIVAGHRFGSRIDLQPQSAASRGATRSRSAWPACARSTVPTSASSTAKTSRTARESRRSSPTGCCVPART